MSGIFNWFGVNSAASADPSGYRESSSEPKGAAADFAPQDEYCGPSPFDTPPITAKDRANCERILRLAREPVLNARELKALITEIEPLLDHPGLVIEGFNRNQVVVALYNAIHRLPLEDRKPLWADHRSSFLFDKLIKATYEHYKKGACQSKEEHYPFYIQLFHQAVKSPSFTFLFDRGEFFSQFDKFAQTGALVMVEGSNSKQFALELLEEQLEYLALNNPLPESNDAKNAVNHYLVTRASDTPISVKVRLAISTLQRFNPGIKKIEGLIPQGSYDLTPLFDNKKEVLTTLRTWIVQQNKSMEYFQMHNAIKDALDLEIIQPEQAIELQKLLLSKVVVNDSKDSILLSLAALQEAAKPLEKGLTLYYSIPIAKRFMSESERLKWAIGNIIYRERFLDPTSQRLAQQLSMHLSQIENEYLAMALEIAIKRASIRIDATDSQFTLPAIDMKGSVTKRGRDKPQPGRGACLPIAAYTCNMLLKGQIQDREDLNQAIYLGTGRHQAILKTTNEPEGTHLHSENLEVFFPQLLREFPTGNALDNALQLKKDLEKRAYETPLMTMDRICDLQSQKKIAAVIRIRGAFLSILFDKSKGSLAITIADSHGINHGPAYAYTFSSINDAATFLSLTYPYKLSKQRSLDPANSGEINYLTLPEREESIAEDIAYAAKARLATGQKPYSYR